MPSRRDCLLLAVIALAFGGIVAAAVPHPTYTDAYYYFNAGQRIAAGQGLTDPYIAITYLDAPQALPGPSHLYWMPLASFIVALAGGSFRLAQAFFVLLWAGLALLAFVLGALLGRSRRHAWAAGLLVVFSGFFPVWLVNTDNFAPFGLPAALCLLLIGLGRSRDDGRFFAAAGALAGVAHLARADGLLLLVLLGLLALWPARSAAASWQRRIRWGVFGGLAYLLVMAPWFVRNLGVIGTALPTSGTSTIWLRGYDEIAAYPPSASLQNFLAWGAGNILQSRLEALLLNLRHFVFEQGMIVLGPLIVIALWKRRRDPLLTPVWLYALALHAVMTLLFAYPGIRGALFHSSTALLPWWAALGILGLDDVVDWFAARRKRWQPRTAKRLFTVQVVMIAVALTVAVSGQRLAVVNDLPPLVHVANVSLPDDAIVMSNLPPAVYYYTGLWGVPVPAADPEAIRALAERYRLTHLLLDENRPQPFDALYEGRTPPPEFLRPVPQDVDESVRVFEIVLP